MTTFNSDEWCDRMRKAKDGKEIGELLDKLPYRPGSSPEAMPATSRTSDLLTPPEVEPLRTLVKERDEQITEMLRGS